MNHTEMLVALRKAVEGGSGDRATREEVDQRVREILAPLDNAEKITILNKVKRDMGAHFDDRKRRLNGLLLAITGLMDAGKGWLGDRLLALSEARDVCGLMPPAELRRAFAATGQDVVRRCGRPDARLDSFAAAVRASDLLPEAEDATRIKLDDEMMHIACGGFHRMARWALFGFNVFSPSASLAAKLVLTDVPDDAVPPLPYDTFVIALPEGVIPFFTGNPDATRKEWADSIWIHRVIVEGGCEPIVVVSVAWRRLVINRQVAAPMSVLGPSPHPGDHLAREDEVAIEGAWRLARNFLLWLDASGGLKKHHPTSVPRKLQEKRFRSGATWPTEWEFGREVTITTELRQAAREVVVGRTERHAVDGWRVRSRFIVRGHWRNQAHGTGRQLRTKKWIEPFWKGPDGTKAWSHLYEGK